MSNHNYEDIFIQLKEEEGGACEACGGMLKAERVNLEDLENGKLYMMESVPSLVCQDCGEMFVPETILKEFEKMIATAKSSHKKTTKKKRRKKS